MGSSSDQQLRFTEWQNNALDVYFSGGDRKDFLAVVTPGGGKTRWAMAVAKGTGIPRVIVVCPTIYNGISRKRLSLQNSGKCVSGKTMAGNHRERQIAEGPGTFRKRPHLDDDGRGVHAKGVHHAGVERSRQALGTAGAGVQRRNIAQTGAFGIGVQKRLLHLSSNGQGAFRSDRMESLKGWFSDLCYRLERVRVCCGDWKRVTGESVTVKHGLTAVFLDPPYETQGRDGRCYVHDANVWEEVWPWAIANGANPLLRIALCGYEGEAGGHLVEAGWAEVPWKTQGGYGAGVGKRGDANRDRERIWFSPHCLVPGRDAEQLDLLGGVG